MGYLNFNIGYFYLAIMVRKLLIITFFSCLAISLKAQDDNAQMAQDFLEIANETYFNTRAIIQANELYVQAADLDPNNIEANYMAGRTSLETNFKSKATEYLLRVYKLDPEYQFNLLFLIAQSLQYGLKFDQAIQFYNLYLEKVNQQSSYRGQDYTSPEEVDRKIFECKNGIEYTSNPGNYRLENAGGLINSEWDDFSPVLNADETMIVFTTRRGDGNLNPDVFDDNLYFEDIFISTKQNGQWLNSTNIGQVVNTPFHDSNLALSADGKELYIYRDSNAGDIYYSEYRPDGTWSKPVALDAPINSSYTENSFSLSPDGEIAFFSSSRPGSIGGLDIYYATRDRKGNWNAARNLGPTINTPYDEDGPFIDYDGKSLYFSSKGLKGMGGFDIYKSVYDSATQTWGEPINLGFPINTPDNDVFFVSTPDGERGWYSSAREDGLGFTDVYQVWLSDEIKEASQPTAQKEPEPTPQPDPEPEPVQEKEPVVVEPEPQVTMQPVTLLLRVVDEKTKNPVDVSSIELLGAEGVPVRLDRVETGTYQASFNHNAARQYQLNVEKEGYMYKSLAVDVPASSANPQTIKRLLNIDPLQVGYRSVLRNIYFDYGKATLTSASSPELDKLKTMLSQNPNLQVEISGHTDSSGSKDFNKKLSQRRAQAVVDYLANAGISRAKMTAVGYGEEQPLASNDDEDEGRELNRRVEFKILGNQ